MGEKKPPDLHFAAGLASEAIDGRCRFIRLEAGLQSMRLRSHRASTPRSLAQEFHLVDVS